MNENYEHFAYLLDLLMKQISKGMYVGLITVVGYRRRQLGDLSIASHISDFCKRENKDSTSCTESGLIYRHGTKMTENEESGGAAIPDNISTLCLRVKDTNWSCPGFIRLDPYVNPT